MKKVLLTAMALLTLASASVFGMYGNSNSWIDFLVHGNQLRARMEQFGFTLGNGTIKGTFGFKANRSTLGKIVSATTGKQEGNGVSPNGANEVATISAGIGYTSPVFGIGVGYNYTFIDKYFGIHTPVLAINALEDNLRIVVPVQIAAYKNDGTDPKNYSSTFGQGGVNYMGISMDPQIRYYTGIDAFNAIRFTLYYGNNSYEETATGSPKYVGAQTLGFELRLYFLNMPLGNVTINPFVKINFDTALNAKGYYGNKDGIVKVTSADNVHYYENDPLNVTYKKFESNPYEFAISPVLGMTASSDLVTLYVEPSLGYKLAGGGFKDAGLTHALTWGAYTELYVTPVKDLEWYFEMNVNGDATPSTANKVLTPVYFETSTGITWYLPSLNGAE